MDCAEPSQRLLYRGNTELDAEAGVSQLKERSWWAPARGRQGAELQCTEQQLMLHGWFILSLLLPLPSGHVACESVLSLRVRHQVTVPETLCVCDVMSIISSLGLLGPDVTQLFPNFVLRGF